MSKRNTVITGGLGFIGGHIAESLAHDTVHILDKDSCSDQDSQVTRADIRDESAVDETVAGADVVFHEAALVSVGESIEKPALSHATNATGTLTVLEAARKQGQRQTDDQGQPRVVFASSAAVYGHPEYTPVDEDHPKEPTSPYGIDKLTADHYCRRYHDLYDVETVSLRYFNVYGPGQSGDYAGVITTFIEQALDGGPITVHGDGSQTRDFVFIDDVVQANRLAATTENVGTAYNVGTGESITIRQLAELIQDVTDTSADIVHTDAREGDITQSKADVSRARDELGFEPTVSLRDGLEETVGWVRERGC